jgi:hypothetical protein
MPDADPPVDAAQSPMSRFAFGELTPVEVDTAANVAFGGRGIGCALKITARHFTGSCNQSGAPRASGIVRAGTGLDPHPELRSTESLCSRCCS